MIHFTVRRPLPMIRATTSSEAAPSSHVTMPSGTGPVFERPHPPRSSGWRVERTYFATEASCASESCARSNAGITHGPRRTAS